MEELEKMSLVELRLYGRKLGMKNATTFKKQELIGEIQKILAAQNTPTRERTERVSGDKKEEASAKTGKRTVSRRTAKQNSGEDNSKEAVGFATQLLFLCEKLAKRVSRSYRKLLSCKVKNAP